MLQQRLGQGLATQKQQQQQNRRNVVCRSRVLHGEHGHGDHHVPWYQKHKEMWLEVDSKDGFAQALAAAAAGEKLLLVDYYAPFCAVCKTAYPSLCRIADNQQYKQDYIFCKASLDHPEVKEWVKAEGIRGIPHLSIYSGSGQKLLGMGASFKRMEAVKNNLEAIAKNKEAVVADGHELQLDPNAFVLLPGSSAVVAQ